MIDLHSHVLPGLDDGPPTLAGAVALARAAASAGTRQLAATPHIDHHYGLEPAQVHASVAALNRTLVDERVPIEVLAGGEIALTRIDELSDDDLADLGLDGGPYLLLESPHVPVVGVLESAIFDLQVRGHRVLLAHPERSPIFLRDRERLARLVDRDVLCSITAGSLAGAFGRTVRRFALDLVRAGLVHDIASDAHDTVRRPPGLLAGLAAARSAMPGIGAQAPWLTQQAPAAILAGTELPPRPDLEPDRTSRRRRVLDAVRPGARRR